MRRRGLRGGFVVVSYHGYFVEEIFDVGVETVDKL